mmetsp:Transcript_19831/g.54741  ORF Transcript_19831/g.54741 Transcript_19831/m.54741 type:complete len:84 (-) Transcript_19831:26-277(-)
MEPARPISAQWAEVLVGLELVAANTASKHCDAEPLGRVVVAATRPRASTNFKIQGYVPMRFPDTQWDLVIRALVLLSPQALLL